MDRSKPNSRRPPRSGMSLLDTLEIATQHPNETRPMPIKMSQITVDERVQVRVDGLDQTRLQEYRIIVENGGEMDAILVYNDHKLGYILADGFHRVEVYRQLGRETIMAIVRSGSYEEAYEYAETANLDHGLAYSNEDKKNILRRRIQQGRAWFSWGESGDLETTVSMNQMARQLGVSQPTISAWINDILAEISRATSKNLEVNRSKVVGKDGRRIDTSRIGSATPTKPKREPVQPLPSYDEDEDFDSGQADKLSTATHMRINAGGESRIVEKLPVERTPVERPAPSRNADADLALQLEKDVTEVVALLTRYDTSQVRVLGLLGKQRVAEVKDMLSTLELWAQEMNEFLSSIPTPSDRPRV